LFGDHLGSGRFVNTAHRQQHSAGDVAAVVLVLLAHIQDDDFLGVHHLFGFFLGDLLVGIVRGSSAAPGQQEKGKQKRNDSFHLCSSKSPAAKALWPCSVKCTPS